MSRRTKWMIIALSPAAGFAISTVAWLIAQSWLLAAVGGAATLCLALAAQVQRYVYRSGFAAGILDVTRLLQTGESKIMRGDQTPEPWDEP